MSSPKSADTSPSPAPSSVGGSNAPKFGTVIPNRVFVGGISSSTTEQDLLELFSHYGTVKATKVINDRAGVSKGYGFVTFETEDEARRLTQEADNIMLKERKLNIAPAIKKQVTEFGGFMKAYSPRLVDGVAGAGGVVAGNPAATVFFANHTAAAAAAAYYNQQQQQLLAAAAAANSQGGVQQEYAAPGHHALAYASPHHLATQQGAYQGLHTGQAAYQNLHTGQAAYQNLHAGQAVYQNLHTGQAVYQNLHTGQAAYQNLHTGQAAYQNLHTGQAAYQNLHTGQAAYQNQAAAHQAAALAAVSNGGSSNSPTQPQYAQPHTASPGSGATYAYPPTVYYPHYQLHAVAAQQQQQQQQQLYQQQVAQQNAAAAAAGWPSATGGGVGAAQWRYFTPQQAYAAAAAAAAAHSQHQPGRATDQQQQSPQRSPPHPPLPVRTLEGPASPSPYLQADPPCPVPGFTGHPVAPTLASQPASLESPPSRRPKHKKRSGSFLAAGSVCSSTSSARLNHSTGRPVHSSPRKPHAIGYSSQSSLQQQHSGYPINFSPHKHDSVVVPTHPSRKCHSLGHPKHSSPRPSHSASLYSRRHRLDPVTLSPFLPEIVGSSSPLEKQRRSSSDLQQRGACLDVPTSSDDSSSSTTNDSSSSSCSSNSSECSTCARSQSLSLGSYNSCFLSRTSRTEDVPDVDSGDMLSVFSDPSESESFTAYNVNKGQVTDKYSTYQEHAASSAPAYVHKGVSNVLGAGAPPFGERAGAGENHNLQPHMPSTDKNLGVFNSLDSCYTEQLSNCSDNTSDIHGETRGEFASPQPYSCPRSAMPVWCWPSDCSVPALLWPPTPQYSPYSATAAATQVLLPLPLPSSPHPTTTPLHQWLCPCHHPSHYPMTPTPHIFYSIPSTPTPASSTTAPTRTSSVASQSSVGLWRSHSHASSPHNSGAPDSPSSACQPSYCYAVCSPYTQPYHPSPAFVFHYPCPAVAAAGHNLENCACGTECVRPTAPTTDGARVSVSLDSGNVTSGSHIPQTASSHISGNVAPGVHTNSPSLKPNDPGVQSNAVLVQSCPSKRFFSGEPHYSSVQHSTAIEVNTSNEGTSSSPTAVPTVSVGAANAAVTQPVLSSFSESVNNYENPNTATTTAAAAAVVCCSSEVSPESQRDYVKPMSHASVVTASKNKGTVFPAATVTPVLTPVFPVTAVVAAAAAAAASAPMPAKPPVVTPFSVSTLPRLQSNSASLLEQPFPYYYHACVPPIPSPTSAAKYSPFR